ncbi:MAG: hypothetical protein QOI58_282 [Thermoanaerobaculia bacterium]|jgi:uncharacterized membrane protein YkoI|nr:hypothetical protein [Thermoanaerobaculia bacterium]
MTWFIRHSSFLAQHLLPLRRTEGNVTMKSRIAVLTLIAVFGIGTAAIHASDTKKKAEDQATLQKEAKISLEKAREIALKKAPGTVKSSELEREHGKLIYSFDIQTSKTDITEVNVDAIDGKIIAVEHESAKKEAEEKKNEAKEEKKH